ncbi:metallophosphoesterase family protein [Bacillus marinisedimentorum]|uniref:metallophosphoesterase family protein n=1 Tax=Bacillus marinisedimentorum TaxID=1821260 RepID=UPI000872A14D|nr:metallophosphoesterase [Bacillus marinisedimentorum]
MKVLIISDTHMPKRAKELPAVLKKDLKDAGLIIHAGDWQTLALYEELQQYAPVEGVAGNVDGDEVAERFGLWKLIEAEGVQIGIVHGHGKGWTTERRAIAAFSDHDPDIIIFGHSHIPIHKEVNGQVVFNPGSPTDKRRQKQFSYGVMMIEAGNFTVGHVFFEDRAP